MILDSCDIPIVLAPLAGGPSTPELAAEVSNAGGLASSPPATSPPPSWRAGGAGWTGSPAARLA